MAAKAFSGTNVCLSPSLVPPEAFDALHDVLNFNDAQEKFEYLRSNNCNLLGPQCVLFCAKERRKLPNQGYTCCIAFDGVNIVTSGFEKDVKGLEFTGRHLKEGQCYGRTGDEKNIIRCQFHNCEGCPSPKIQATKKVTRSFNLIIDERKEMEKLVVQNGGIYSSELTKTCSHLICDISCLVFFFHIILNIGILNFSKAPEGDEYVVSKRRRIVYIVNRKWFHQSIARRGKGTRNFQPTSSSIPTASELDTSLSAKNMEPDVQNLLTNTPCTSSEDDDLNLSECRVLLLGFEASELRKLVNMVRQGGGSRYMSVREKLTHVLVGIPSKKEIKEIRSLAAFGVVSIVKASWLEECTIKKKEVPVFQGHIAYDLPYSQIL
ncbi:hypothetical protein SASPL_123596 [Salvia splendens]|uniref:BRCT domain-containing protein n=2 Tax=Salvia splendens TaxID=180675 RepID=A0A8X8ZT56_SALSN|nr:hypothetical protein SASPL_123596 [Salvia splendens]